MVEHDDEHKSLRPSFKKKKIHSSAVMMSSGLISGLIQCTIVEVFFKIVITTLLTSECLEKCGKIINKIQDAFVKSVCFVNRTFQLQSDVFTSFTVILSTLWAEVL